MHYKFYDFDSHTRLAIPAAAGNRYLTQNAFISLEGMNMPLVINELHVNAATYESDFEVVKFKVPADATLNFDGAIDTVAHFLAKNQSKAFKTLKITAKNKDGLSATLTTYDSQGTLKANNGRLELLM